MNHCSHLCHQCSLSEPKNADVQARWRICYRLYTIIYTDIQWLTPVPPPCFIVWDDGCDVVWVKFGVLASLLDGFCGDLTFVTTFVTSFGSFWVLWPLFGSILVPKVDLFDDFWASLGAVGLSFWLHLGALASLGAQFGSPRRKR